MRHDHWDLGIANYVARDPSQRPFPRARVAKTTHHKQVCIAFGRFLEKGRSYVTLRCNDLQINIALVPRQMGAHILAARIIGRKRRVLSSWRRCQVKQPRRETNCLAVSLRH